MFVLSVRVPGCQKLQMTAKPGLAQDTLWLYVYGNSGRQRVNLGQNVGVVAVIIIKYHFRLLSFNPQIHPGVWNVSDCTFDSDLEKP